jgi:hypothetical protein
MLRSYVGSGQLVDLDSSENKIKIGQGCKICRTGMGSVLQYTGGEYACLILLQGVSSYLVLLVLERSMGLICIALSGGRKSPSCSSCKNGSSDSMIAVSEAILSAAAAYRINEYDNSEINHRSLLSANIFCNTYITLNSIQQ